MLRLRMSQVPAVPVATGDSAGAVPWYQKNIPNKYLPWGVPAGLAALPLLYYLMGNRGKKKEEEEQKKTPRSLQTYALGERPPAGAAHLVSFQASS